MGLFIPAAIAGISALGGALSNTKGSRTSTSKSTTTPIEAPEYTGLRDLLIKRAMEGVGGGSSLPHGYLEGGVQNINRTSDAGDMALNNRLAAMGLSNSPVAANAAVRSATNRAGQINQFENVEAPAFEQLLQQRELENAMSLFRSRPMGTTTSGTDVGPGSVAGGAFTKASDMLAFLYGMGAFGNKSGSAAA